METVADFIFLGSKITADGDCSHEIKRRLLLGRKLMANLDSILKNRHHVVNKGPSSQGYGFSSGHVWMWESDYKESWSEVKWSEVTQSCPTLCDPMDCSLPRSSVHGIFQARVLEWVVISFARGSSKPRDWTRVFGIVSRSFTIWATGKSYIHPDWSQMDLPDFS